MSMTLTPTDVIEDRPVSDQHQTHATEVQPYYMSNPPHQTESNPYSEPYDEGESNPKLCPGVQRGINPSLSDPTSGDSGYLTAASVFTDVDSPQSGAYTTQICPPENDCDYVTPVANEADYYVTPVASEAHYPPENDCDYVTPVASEEDYIDFAQSYLGQMEQPASGFDSITTETYAELVGEYTDTDDVAHRLSVY